MNRILIFLVLMTAGIRMPAIGQPDQTNRNTLAAASLKPYGRFATNEKQQLELISSAAHFGVRFNGEELTLFAGLPELSDHNYLQVELDGKYQGRIRVDGNSRQPISIKASGAGVHTLWIYKATEAHTGPVVIAKVMANQIETLTETGAPVIEFIGNSITCGAAADPSDVPCGTGVYHDQHNAYMAYGPRVARMLGANFVLSSVSGIGVYRTWNQEGPSMPQVYEKTDFQIQSSARWDFKTFTPALVSIALGTNDLSEGDGKKSREPFSEEEFIKHYTSFVKQVKTKYPKARIVLLSSPMERGTRAALLEKCLTRIKEAINQAFPADSPVATFYFKPMDAHGCSGHPGVEDHLVIARALKPLFADLLKDRQ